MKKILLLSVVASTMIMAGGDIIPVEPVVETLTPEVTGNTSDWDLTGQAVIYYQTTDNWGKGGLFDQGPAGTDEGWAKAAAGVQLSAVNKNLIGGFGAGVELSALSSLGLHHDLVSGLVQNAGGTMDGLTGGALTQAYFTYGAGNTSFKVGRQQLPKSLSPFAFSEGWNVFKNTFDAALLVNTDISNTTLVGAYVTRANNSLGNLNDFTRIQGGDGTAMITLQNKSIEGLTLTASAYNVFDVAQKDDNAQAYWGDAKFKMSGYAFGLQGGIIGVDADGYEDTSAFGAMMSGNIGRFGASLAYSTVDDGDLSIANIAGSGVKTPLYTQGVLNQNTIKRDSDTFKITGSVKGLGGKFIAAYINSDLGKSALPSVFGTSKGGEGEYQEIEVMYKASYGKHTKFFIAYINQNDDRQSDDSQNLIRIWTRYNF